MYYDDIRTQCNCGECWSCKGDEDPRWCHEGERETYLARARAFKARASRPAEKVREEAYEVLAARNEHEYRGECTDLFWCIVDLLDEEDHKAWLSKLKSRGRTPTPQQQKLLRALGIK